MVCSATVFVVFASTVLLRAIASSTDATGATSGIVLIQQRAAKVMLSNVKDNRSMVVQDLVMERFAARPPRYVFGVSTGHCGSTSLSDPLSYEGKGKKAVSFHFENLFGSQTFWKDFYDSRPSHQELVDKVEHNYKRRVDAKLVEKNASTYMDLGHHNVHGLLGVLPEVFGSDSLLIRLRRSRLKTAFSLASYQRDLCENMYRICPHKDTVLLQPRDKNWTVHRWKKLDFFQQALWYIDEVEAEWQQLRKSYPHAAFFECDWTDDISPCMSMVASVLGLKVARNGQGMKDKQHTHGEKLDEVDLKSRAEAYMHFMDYPEEVLAAITDVQF